MPNWAITNTIPTASIKAWNAVPSAAIPLTPGHQGSGILIPHIGGPGSLTIRVEYSFDGGVTWPHFVEGVMLASPVDRSGNPVDHELKFEWANPQSARPTHQRHFITSPSDITASVHVIELRNDMAGG